MLNGQIPELNELLLVIETALEQTVTAKGATPADTSQKVKQQYEQYPYPQWRGMPVVEPTTPRQWLNKQFDEIPEGFPAHNQKILVAGCGTGQHALMVANRYRSSTIVAIDLSEQSLAYAKKQAKKYQVNNVEFVQGDILDLNPQGQKYAMIECVGVLHHMANMAEGLHKLIARLEPGGIIKLGLYSKTARVPIDYFKARYGSKTEIPDLEILRKFRQTFISDKDANPDYQQRIMRFLEFYYTNGFVDLFYHTAEQSVDIAFIETLMYNAGLKFMGFDLPANHNSLKTDLPDFRELTAWKKTEAEFPWYFEGMYQFWCRLPVE